MGIKNAIRVLVFPIGLLFGYFFYYSTVRRLKLDTDLDIICLLVILTATATLFSLSINFRCISCLTIPTFLARNFRSILITLIITSLIEGPINNVSNNVSSSATSLTCFARIKIEQSTTKYKFLYEPSLKIVKAMISEQQSFAQQVGVAIKEQKKFEEEILSDKETKDLLVGLKENPVSRAKVEAMDARHKSLGYGRSFSGDKAKDNFNYHLKNDVRCLDTKQKLAQDCKDKIEEEARECKKLNGPGNEEKCSYDDKPCNEWTDPDADKEPDAVNCEEMAPLSEDYASDMYNMKDGTDKLSSDANVTASVDVQEIRESVSVRVSDEYKSVVQKIVLRKSLWIRAFLYLMDLILIIIFVIIFVSAVNYNYNYRRHPNYDNIYVTEYFRAIDLRRLSRHKMTLLPMKDLDKKQVVDVYSFRLFPDEKKKLKINILILITALLIVLIIIYVDIVLASLLISFKRHGNIDYHQYGWRHDEYIVTGNGSMAQKMRRILDEMSGETSFTKFSSSDPCLPDAQRTPEDIYNLITIYFVIWLLLALTEAYLLRTRRFICAHFYPKREKARTLFLYNQTLKTRKRMIKYKIDRAIREKEVENRIFKSKVEDGSKEDGAENVLIRRSPKECRLCHENPVEEVFCTKCFIFYCHQCWDALKHVCLDCNSGHAFQSFLASNLRDNQQVTKFAPK